MSEISKLQESQLKSITFQIETLKKLRDTFKVQQFFLKKINQKLGSSIEISCQHFKEISMIEFPQNGSFLSKVVILFMKQLNTISTGLQTITQVFQESKINIKDNISLFEKLKSDIKQTYTSFDDQFLIHKKEFKNIVQKQRNISNELIRLQIETLNNQNILEYQQLVSQQKNLKGQSIQIQQTLNQHQINLERQVQSFGDQIEKNINGSQQKAIQLISFSLNEYIRVYQNIFKSMNNQFVLNPQQQQLNQKAIVQQQIIDQDDVIKTKRGQQLIKQRQSKSQYNCQRNHDQTNSSSNFFVESYSILDETLEDNFLENKKTQTQNPSNITQPRIQSKDTPQVQQPKNNCRINQQNINGFHSDRFITPQSRNYLQKKQNIEQNIKYY